MHVIAGHDLWSSHTAMDKDEVSSDEVKISFLWGMLFYLDKTMPKHNLFKATHDILSLNKTIIVPSYIDTESFNFSVEDLKEYFGISPHKPVQAHSTFHFSVPLTLD